jgi:hypothetical protein
MTFPPGRSQEHSCELRQSSKFFFQNRINRKTESLSAKC